MDSVGRRLKEERQLKGWSQRDLARETGVNPDTISGIETEQHEPRPSTLRKLAEGLGLEVRDFFAEPALPKVEAPREAGQSSAEQAEVIEGLANAVASVADRTKRRLEQADDTDGDALVALFEDAFLAQMGAERLLEQVNEEASQAQTATPAERRARANLDHAVMRLADLFENMAAELEEAEESAKLVHLAEERRRRRAG